MLKLFLVAMALTCPLTLLVPRPPTPPTCALVTHDVPITHEEYPIEDCTDDMNDDPSDKPMEDYWHPPEAETESDPKPRHEIPRHAFRPRRPIVRP